MGLRTRGRVPGPAGAPAGLRRGFVAPSYVPSFSHPGPVGLPSPGTVLLAEAATPVTDVATDAGSGQTAIQLTEPEPVFGQPVAFQNVDLPLFAGDPTVPQTDDVMQGALNNCPVAAILAALAQVAPESVAGMIVRSSADVRSRRRSDPEDSFQYRTDRLYTVYFRAASPIQVSSFLYYTEGVVAYCHSPDDRASWMSYIEKAYAVMRGGGSYNRLNTTTQMGEPPTVNRVMEDLAGPFDLADLESDLLYRSGAEPVALSDAELRRALARADRRATIAGSRGGGIPDTVVPNHAYTVLGRAANSVSLRNPHGGPGAAVTFSLNEFRTIFRAVLQATEGS